MATAVAAARRAGEEDLMPALLITLAISIVLCGLYLKLARRLQIMDLPNERSSHTLPTPHGGGTAMLVAFSLGLAAAAWMGMAWHSQYLALAGGALLLMLVGVVDDLRGLPVRLRFSFYALCSVVLVSVLLKPHGGQWLVALVAAFALLWMLNLYNFMDGIDGIAALQATIACVGAAIISWFYAADLQYFFFCLLLAAAQLGFLCWNWPPARMFMGDAGSVPTGFLVGGLALLGAVEGTLPLACWLILLAVFVTDASYTLVARMFAGERFTQPHRTHAYQRLSRHWGGHLPVDMLLLAINALWLFPLALTTSLCPKFSFLLVILAYIPLLYGMAKARKVG
ncbi:glycosyltransferase family 4 protein [Halioglobus maricola]|uniref:Glycosyltransferase family 4 protein n=1 Tax=Halioglobus maricola TaxID=2601894 RepID=A0A5P9NIG5_9GAMM|nr:glycosyltransferase family 4 protein [Halioglobus maricola]QFU75339.1 glycosyltransferase family 4 protein [Halioglobus maricola]